MKTYTATEEEMKAYCDIIQRITYCDIQMNGLNDQKQRLLAELVEWEQAHAQADGDEVPADDPDLEKVGLPA